MTAPASNAPRAATLDDLAALNREMAAFVAAGLPLEEGLRQVARDYGGGVGPLAARLAEGVAAGQSLDAAITAQGDAFPPIYRAVVLAGLKSGHLAAALEGYAESAARVAALRRTVGQAAVYPLLVVIIAWLMFLATVCLVVPAYDWLGWSDRFWASSFRPAPSTAWRLAVIVPAAIMTTAVLWWRRSARWSSTEREGSWRRWIPGARRAQQLSGQANFAELLQLLLSCQVPLPDALALAANACGVLSISQPAEELAAGINSGHGLSEQRHAVRRLPPLLRAALLAHGASPEQHLLTALRQAASIYRERAANWVNDVSVTAPVAATVVVGVGVVGLYAVLVWQPYAVSLDAIAQWNWH